MLIEPIHIRVTAKGEARIHRSRDNIVERVAEVPLNPGNGCCLRISTPRYSVLLVKKYEFAYASISHFCSRPNGYENPTSGLNDHRAVPRFRSLSGSYFPVGVVTVKLTPIDVAGL
jgi:hypothetical protein